MPKRPGIEHDGLRLARFSSLGRQPVADHLEARDPPGFAPLFGIEMRRRFEEPHLLAGRDHRSERGYRIGGVIFEPRERDHLAIKPADRALAIRKVALARRGGLPDGVCECLVYVRGRGHAGNDDGERHTMRNSTAPLVHRD
jgi:hypothetical protein